MKRSDFASRREYLITAIAAAGAGIWQGTYFDRFAVAGEDKPPTGFAIIGRDEIIKGLDGMSRVAEPGNDPFIGGHVAAAVMSSAFFCREQNISTSTQQELLSFMQARLLKNPMFAPRPADTTDPELIVSFVKDLDAGISSLRRSGHNIIFADVCLKSLREAPEAVTPERIVGLRKMVQSFGTGNGSRPVFDEASKWIDLNDEPKFVHFVFEEYLKALDLYMHGKGHHGFAGHVLTVGHALLELKRMGYQETAFKGVEAYWQFVQQARKGANLGGKKVNDAPMTWPSPLDKNYWVDRGQHAASLIVSSHLIKYPYSFFALAKELRDEDLKQRVLQSIYQLTAIS